MRSVPGPLDIQTLRANAIIMYHINNKLLLLLKSKDRSRYRNGYQV